MDGGLEKDQGEDLAVEEGVGGFAQPPPAFPSEPRLSLARSQPTVPMAGPHHLL
jgi:hypothetical protein